jgi:outer membrane receptor for ferrienterochelin and colicins
VIRGPGSALYGADAYAGVINLITKTAADVGGTEVGSRLGSSTAAKPGCSTAALGAVDVAAYLHWGKTDGQKEAAGARHTKCARQAPPAPAPAARPAR